MKAWSLAGICAVLFASVLTTWVPERWPVSILEVGSFVLALAWLIRLAVSGERPRLTPVLIPLAALAGWGVLQLALGWTVAASDTVRLTLTWAANLALVFACLQTFAGRGIRRRFLNIVLWFAVAISVAAVVQSFTAGGKILWLFPERNPAGTMGPVPYHTHFAVFVEAILPLALIAALDDARKRLWTSFMAAAMIAAVIVSASRGGFVMLVVEVAGVIALHEWRKRRGCDARRSGRIGNSCDDRAAHRHGGMERIVRAARQPDPYAGRREMLLSSIAMARDHFWTGVGLGCWPAAYPQYAIYDDGFFANQAHGDWGQFAGEAGIVGLAAFGGLFLLTLRRAIGNVWCLGLVCVFIHAFFDYPFQKPQIAALVMALLAAAES